MQWEELNTSKPIFFQLSVVSNATSHYRSFAIIYLKFRTVFQFEISAL